MPIHILPISRRQFLRRTLGASASLLVLPKLRAQDAKVDPHRWALFSDTHIDADRATMRLDVNMADHLVSAISEVQALATQPAGLIINGDCAYDHGLAEDYATLTQLLHPLADIRLPMHLSLGNHDDREVFWKSVKGAKSSSSTLANRQVAILESERANWILLDSLEVTKQTPGRVGDTQREWLAKALDERPDKPALVMVHHNPQPADAPKKTGLLDSAELLQVLLPRKQVKALFFGHTHTWRVTEQEGMHLVNLPAVAYPFSPEEVTGWIDCRLRENGAALEVRAQDTKNPAHGKVRELVWRKA